MHNPMFKAIKGGLMAAGVVALAAGPALAAAPNSCSGTCKHHGGKGIAKAAYTTLVADDNDCSSTCKHHGKASKAAFTAQLADDNDCSSTCKHHGQKLSKAAFLG